MDGGIRTATVVFTDLVGSTEIRTRLGDDRADDLRRQHDELIRRATGLHGGVVVKSTGDGFLVRFDSAHEALAASVAVHQELHRLNSANPAAELHVRIGISAGDIVVEDGDIHGTPVVEAARLEATAATDEILCTPIVKHLVGSRGEFEFRPKGLLELKGLAHPVDVSSVIWSPADEPVEAPPIASIDAPALGMPRPEAVVGRGAVLAELEAGLGLGIVQIITGEAGIGKTTVLAELAHRRPRGAECRFGSADDLANAPLEAMHQALPELLEIVLEDPGSFGTASEHRVRVFEGVRRELVRRTASGPLVVILDDVQWLDDASALLLRHLVARPIEGLDLVLGLRSGSLAPDDLVFAVLADLRRRPTTRIFALSPLSSQACVELAEQLGVELADPEELVEQTDGNPLLVREVLRVPDGEPPGQALAEMVARRVRQISTSAVELLEAAAVLGPSFAVSTAAGIAETEREVALDILDLAESNGLAIPSEPGRYRFRHALVRDAILAGVRPGRRATLHRRAAMALIDTGGNAGAIAGQFVAALPTGTESQAHTWSVTAGREALANLGYEQAAEHFRTALELFPSDAPEERAVDLLLDRGRALAAASRFGEARSVYRSAAERADAIGDVQRRGDALIGAFDQPENTNFGEQPPPIHLRALTEATEPRQWASLAAWPLIAAFDRGDAESAMELADRAVAAATDVGDPALLTFVRRAQLRSWWDPAKLTERTELARGLVVLGLEQSRPDVEAWGHRWCVICALEAADIPTALVHADHLESIAGRIRFPFHTWFARTRRAVALNAAGRFAEAARSLESGLAIGRPFDTPYVNLMQSVLRTGACLGMGMDPAPVDLAALRSEPDSPHWWILAEILAGGDSDGAIRAAHTHVVGPGRMHHPSNVALWLADLAWHLSDPELAGAALGALEHRDQSTAALSAGTFVVGSLAQKRGIANLVLGNWVAAEKQLVEAGRIESERGLAPSRLRSDWARARALESLGRLEEARALRSATRAVADDLGMGRLTLLEIPRE